MTEKGFAKFHQNSSSGSHSSFFLFSPAHDHLLNIFLKENKSRKLKTNQNKRINSPQHVCTLPAKPSAASHTCPWSLPPSLGRSRGTCLSTHNLSSESFVGSHRWSCSRTGRFSGPWRCQIYKEQGRMATELTRILYGCECLNVRNAEKGAFLTVLPEGFAGTHWKYTPTH